MIKPLLIFGMAGFFFLLLFGLHATAQTNQVLQNGAPTTAVTFGGAGCVYKWTNDNPAIGLAASGTGDIASFTAINNGTSPVTATIVATPQTTGFAYIVNRDDGTVSVINTATNTVTATIDLRTGPGVRDGSTNPVTVSQDGRFVYVGFAGRTIFSLIIIDAVSNQVIKSIQQDFQASALVVNSDNSKLYVGYYPTYLHGLFRILDPKTLNVINQINTGFQTDNLALSSDDRFLYMDDYSIGTLAAFNTVTGRIVGTIPNLWQPVGLAASPDGKYLYVCDQGLGTVTKYSTTDYSLLSTISISSPPRGVVISPDGKYAYVFNMQNVVMINTQTSEVLAESPVGAPYGISITPDGNNLYLPGGYGDSTAVVNTANNKVIRSVPVGVFPDSFGNFITAGAGCSSKPIIFTITVNPIVPPIVTISSVTGTISSCQGTASSSPNMQQFSISGSNLTAGINAVAPKGFEISTVPNNSYAPSLTLPQTAGTINSTVIYVRSSASAPAGNLTGNVTLSTAGAINQTVAVNGVVNALPTVNQVTNQTVSNGAVTTAVSFTGTGNSFKWFNSQPAIGLPSSGAGNINSFSAVNNGTIPVTATITVNPIKTGYAYVANSGSANVSVIDTSGNLLVATIPVGIYPNGVSVNVDGSRIFVTNSTSNNLSVIDGNSNHVIATVPVGSTPVGVVVSPEGNYAYVANSTSANVSVINTANNSVTSTIAVGGSPMDVAISPDGKFVYVTNVITNNVSVISTTNNAVIAEIQLDDIPAGIAVSHNCKFIYVANNRSNTVSVIDAVSYSTVAMINVGNGPVGLSVSNDDQFVYVTNQISGTVSFISTSSNAVVLTVNTGLVPFAIFVSSDNRRIYVTGNNNLTVIDAATGATVAVVPVGTDPGSIGNFVTNGTGCPGKPMQFTITVEPSPPPSINFDVTTLKSLTTSYGTPSTSTSFTISAENLRAGILITPPPGFEVSTDNSTFSSSITIGSPGKLVLTTIYIRLAAATPVGSYAGSIGLSSTQASIPNFSMLESTVIPASLTIAANSVNKTYGARLAGSNDYAGFLSSGLKNSEIISSVTVAYGKGSLATDPVDTYSGSVEISNATGGSFNPDNYKINYETGDLIVKPAELIATVDDKNKVFGSLNPVFTITYSGFVNDEDASVLTVGPVISTTASTDSPAGQYPITASGAIAENYNFTYIPGVLTINVLAQEIAIPNAFTPNGDGVNDYWNIKFLNLYPKCNVNVYTRYGERVYSSVGYGRPWDGNYNGQPLPMGTYYYVVCPLSGSRALSGSVTIIR